MIRRIVSSDRLATLRLNDRRTRRGGYLSKAESGFHLRTNIPAGGICRMSRAQVAGVLPAMLPRIGLAQPGAEALHQAHCASCHADSRLEGTGPALIPETLGRIHGPKLEAPISEGRPATQKESFADRLAPDAIAAISACLETPLATVPERALLGMPRLGTGITWDWQSTTVMATPHLKDITICFINMKTWTTIKVIAIDRRGFFVRRHPNSRYVWTDVFFGPNKDAMHITDNETLKIVQTLHPEPGTTVAHTEVTKDGSRAPVWIWEEDGAAIVYDAVSLQELQRSPMKKPSGKYNV